MKSLVFSAATAALILTASTAIAADDHHDHSRGDAAHATHASKPHTATKYGKGTPAKEVYHENHTYGAGESPSAVYKNNHSTKYESNHSTSNYGKGKSPSQVYHENHTYGAGKSPAEVYKNNHSGAYAAGHSNKYQNFNRRNVTASRRYHYRGGQYRWPGGYHYQRWSFGATLPSVFWARDYWINDYSEYGLTYPPDGAVWVRYGDDALLVDQGSGQILEVVYGQFD